MSDNTYYVYIDYLKTLEAHFQRLIVVLGDTAPDEMYDLQPVPFAKDSLVPVCAGDDLAVMFDGDTISFKPKFGDQ